MTQPNTFACLSVATISLAVGLLLLSVPLFGQDAGNPMISVQDVVGNIDQPVVIPIEVSGLGDKDVLKIELQVQIPTDILNFLEVRSPGWPEGLTLKASLEPAGGGQSNRANLSIQIDSTRPLVAGTLVEMAFDPSEKIVENMEGVLSIVEASLETADGEKIQSVEVKDGNVLITIPIFSCFFYMH